MSVSIGSPLIVFTQGGKGGVAKTEVALSLVSWHRLKGYDPVLLDFDVENTTKSSLQSFFPEASKFDVHRAGALDEFFGACESGKGLVVADLGAGAGAATRRWFTQAFQDAAELGIRFTAVGVVTNDAGAVQSVLKWAALLQGRVEYVIVLNEMGDEECKFLYWREEKAAEEFTKTFNPVIMKMAARVPEFQAELRNQCVTLQDVIEGKVETNYLRQLMNVQRARRYQRQMFQGFEAAADRLLP